MQTAIPCSVLRGGTSKGLYFRREHLPGDPGQRDAVLLAAMGSPDSRQIDGMGGAHPLTSKVAIVSRGERADVDYLFLQVAVDRAEVSDSQNCGNLLAGVGPFALEEGLLEAHSGTTDVRIHMVNTGGLAVARVQTPGGRVTYEGSARIDGVPGTAAPVMLEFLDIAGSSCGALLPTGRTVDTIEGHEATCIDNGMPVVLLRAADFGKTGYESPAELERDTELKARVEGIRLAAGERMRLGDVSRKTVPKMTLLAPARHGGAISTRTFIPHRVHEAIGVLGSVSVATACLLPGSVAQAVSGLPVRSGSRSLAVEHPTGSFTVEVELDSAQDPPAVLRTALLRTARLLMRGSIFVPASIWDGRT
ncbi:MAG TPA: 4-oxalomesaconate tautomerase [Woeseiaceae bacterium]|nr:4-oxalomesaconate tautomerase [Woeseiaceae bacterium]